MQIFLEAVVPVAQKSGINMAIHPDDPTRGIFGLPRIITNEENLERFLKLVDVPNNGLTFCTGSLGADNDLPHMIRRFADRIHFMHIRNIAYDGTRCFHETAHPTRWIFIRLFALWLLPDLTDMYVLTTVRHIWGERGRYGYGLYDRALGATYLSGLFEAIEKDLVRSKKT